MGLALQFMRLFSGLDRAYGQYVLRPASTGETKRQGKATTLHENLTVDRWESHLKGETGLGIIPIKDDATCSWGAIDIDRYPVDIPELESKCKDLNLPLIPCRTKSGGCHLYLFVAGSVTAAIVRSRLVEFATRLGYPGVEVFPKQTKLANEKDVGNWLNMPYFDCERTQRYAVIAGKEATAEQFLKRAAALQITEQQLIAIELPEVAFDDGPPCLQHLAMSGGIPEGGRNVGVFAMGVYARRKYGDEWEQKLAEYNAKHLSRALPTREVVVIIKSLNRKKYFYPCDKQPCVNNCDKATCKTREFGIGGGGGDEIDVTIGHLVKLNTQPPTWITDVDGVRLELTTDDLLSQERFRKQCVERINKLPNKVKPMVWEKWFKEALQAVEIIEAPEDAGPEGQFLEYVEQFCSTLAQARVKDELLLGKPYVEDGRVFFRSSDLSRYMRQQRMDISLRQAWTVLKRNGAQHHQYKLKGKCVRCWSLPEFERQTEDFTVHDDAGNSF